MQWSDLARNPRQIAEIVDRDGEVRIERRGHEQLLLIQAKRFDTTVAHLDTLTRLVRCLLLGSPIETAVKETFPWTEVMPADARRRFFAEFVETFDACRSLDVWKPLEQMLVEWKATAAVFADPELAAALSGPSKTEDLEPVRPPDVPEDLGPVASTGRSGAQAG